MVQCFSYTRNIFLNNVRGVKVTMSCFDEEMNLNFVSSFTHSRCEISVVRFHSFWYWYEQVAQSSITFNNLM